MLYSMLAQGYFLIAKETLTMAKEVVVTHEGYKKLEEELDTLKTVKRSEIAEKIKVARGYGDLSENAEYDAAKEEQAVVEARIADLEATLKVARIMDDSDLSGGSRTSFNILSFFPVAVK